MPLSDYEHEPMSLDQFPDEIINQRNLLEIASNEKVCFEIQKGTLGHKKRRHSRQQTVK